MNDDDLFEIIWRVFVIVVAVVVLVAVVLYLSHRKSLSCSGDKCRQLKAEALNYLADLVRP